MDKDAAKIIGQLEDAGVLEWYGMEDDEAVFQVDMSKLKEAMPDLYDMMVEDMLEEMDEALLSLYQKGFIDISYDDDLEPIFKITEAGKDYLNGNSEDL